jgi:hypothetical protein
MAKLLWPRTDRKPALYPASAALGWQLSLPQCSAFALFACALSVILTEERSLQFQLRQDKTTTTKLGRASLYDFCTPHNVTKPQARSADLESSTGSVRSVEREAHRPQAPPVSTASRSRCRCASFDELGYLTDGPDTANVPFHVVNDRHLRKRPMFTTSKAMNEREKVPHDDMVIAILERVLERGRFFHLDGP